MGRKSQTIEEWIKAEKARQDWLDQKLRDAGLRRLTHEGQDTIDALISDLEEALPNDADRAEAIRKLKQNWRVFKSSRKNKTINLAANVSKHTRESLKKLAKDRGETQKATLEKLIKEGFQTEAEKKAAIHKATRQAELILADKRPPSEWSPINSSYTREIESLQEQISKKDKEIQQLKDRLNTSASAEAEEDKDKENGMDSPSPNAHTNSKESTAPLERSQSKHSGVTMILRKKNGELY